MPGFFALAVAAWFWADSSRTPAMRLIVEGGIDPHGGACRRAALRGPCGRVDCGGVRADRRADRRGPLAGSASAGRGAGAVHRRHMDRLRGGVPAGPGPPFARSLACVPPAMAIVLAIGAAVDRQRFRGALDRSCRRGRRRRGRFGRGHPCPGIVPRSDDGRLSGSIPIERAADGRCPVSAAGEDDRGAGERGVEARRRRGLPDSQRREGGE